MTGTQLTSVLVAVCAGFLMLAWMLLRGFVAEVKAAVATVARGEECWDEAAERAEKVDRALDLLMPRVQLLERHDVQQLTNDITALNGRLSRVEADIANMDRRLLATHELTAETNTIIREMRTRRRADREET